MDQKEIDITGLSKAAVLAALFNRARQQGLGIFDWSAASNMTEAQAQEVIDARTTDCGFVSYFDYLRGRVMKIDIGGDTLAPHLYDRDNGCGACAAVIEELRASNRSDSTLGEKYVAG